jgi:pimeloyl-ACP methyl ester carboxylesterase
LKTYFISGLGADWKIFSKVKLPPPYEIVHLEWLPVIENETLLSYSLKLAEKINKEEAFTLVGLSFGGLVAVEISKHYKPEKLVLISSVSTRASIPLLYKSAGKLRLEKLLPLELTLFKPALLWFFGPLSAESEEIVSGYILHSDKVLVNWALGEISRWSNMVKPENLIQIHGEKDRAFPASLSNAQYIIPEGGHLCVYDEHKKINEILKKELAD